VNSAHIYLVEGSASFDFCDAIGAGTGSGKSAECRFGVEDWFKGIGRSLLLREDVLHAKESFLMLCARSSGLAFAK